MTDDTLGRLTPVDLRDIWASEPQDFTPWLAREENLAVLAETLDLDLELEAKEKPVGPFRADLLCKDTNSNAWVLIENQLERTDHGHLGQLLTYASGLEAVTIVWIASRFTEEHRSTFDWLNRITDKDFNFFGLEVELWRIGTSVPAPKFNIVSKPNDWSRSVSQAARAIDEGELSATRGMQLAYWTAFRAVLDKSAGPVSSNRKPPTRSAIHYPIGRTGFRLGAGMTRQQRQIWAELYLSKQNAKAFFHLLQEQKEEIEAELGDTLDWREIRGGNDSRIVIYLDDVDPEAEEDWPRQHEWLAARLNDLHRVFANRVKELDAADWQANDDTDNA